MKPKQCVSHLKDTHDFLPVYNSKRVLKGLELFSMQNVEGEGHHHSVVLPSHGAGILPAQAYTACDPATSDQKPFHMVFLKFGTVFIFTIKYPRDRTQLKHKFQLCFT